MRVPPSYTRFFSLRKEAKDIENACGIFLLGFQRGASLWWGYRGKAPMVFQK
jgi:hypothetical protein